MLLLGTGCICARDPGQETMCFIMLCVHTCMFLNVLLCHWVFFFVYLCIPDFLVLPYIAKCSKLLKILCKFPCITVIKLLWPNTMQVVHLSLPLMNTGKTWPTLDVELSWSRQRPAVLYSGPLLCGCSLVLPLPPSCNTQAGRVLMNEAEDKCCSRRWCLVVTAAVCSTFPANLA